jgi:hypothetical protein
VNRVVGLFIEALKQDHTLLPEQRERVLLSVKAQGLALQVAVSQRTEHVVVLIHERQSVIDQFRAHSIPRRQGRESAWPGRLNRGHAALTGNLALPDRGGIGSHGRQLRFKWIDTSHDRQPSGWP